MSSPVLTIATHERFAAELAGEMTIPHRLKTFGTASDNEMAALLADTDALVWGAYKAAWRAPGAAPLRLVHSTGAGTDGIEFPALPPGCTVCNVYGHQWGVAEHAFLLMMALHKNLFGLDQALRKGDWTPQRPYLPELRGRRLLILGLGHIGRELVRWGQFLGMQLTVLTRNPDKDRAAHAGIATLGRLSDLGQHIAAADFVVVAIPAAEGTIDLIGARELGLMKTTAFVINVGRGPVINETALYEALRDRRIAGAGLDVWYRYPAAGGSCLPSTAPFQELDNVIMTPHKPTMETMAYRWKEIADNLARFSRGEALRSVVMPARP
jgi:phosphoglycerate dehydrogenase-like enzyme